MTIPQPDATASYCVVIPTYNNAGTLAQVVRGVLAVNPDVIVVDDGCTDDTPAILAELPITVVRHKRNKGKGVALRSGFREAAKRGFSHAVTIDSDGQHFPDEIGKLVQASMHSPDAVVIGARDMSGENVPKRSSFGRMFSNFWLKVATGIDVGDTQSGFRVYPLRHVNRLFCWGRRFTYECEVIIRLAWGGCPVINVPVRVHYPPKEERVSHFDPFWDNVRFTCLYLYANFSHLLIPLPHKRLVPREPLWQGGLLPTIRHLWRSARRMAALPEDLRMAGGPVARARALVRYLVHEKSSPGELGLAVGIGAFIGCSPALGFHWLIALYAATRVHLNRVACIAATNVSFGPLLALIVFSEIWLGKLLLGQPLLMPDTMDWRVLGEFAARSIGAWVLGSVIIGLAAAFGFGLATLYSVRALRLERQT